MISLNLATGHVENLHLRRFMMKVTIHFLMLKTENVPQNNLGAVR